MARRIEQVRQVDVRADVRARLVESIRRHGEGVDIPHDLDEGAWFAPNPAVAKLAALDAGEPIQLSGWQLSRWLSPADREKHPLWTVNADGSLIPVKVVRGA